MLIKCAKHSPLLTQQCIKQICKEMNYAHISDEGVNPFQICYVINKNDSYFEEVMSVIHSGAWDLHLHTVIDRLKKERVII